MRNEAMHSAVLSAAVGICAIVAYQDVRTRRIPNALSLAMAAVGLVRIAFAQDTVAGGYTVAAGLVIFAVTFALFRCGVIGGGDAKLIPATALVVGYGEVLEFLFLMSLCGGALAAVTIAVDKLKSLLKRLRAPASLCSTAEIDHLGIPPEASTVPYGFAVAAAGVMTLIASR
jgi:prepilin peptidase CpaA